MCSVQLKNSQGKFPPKDLEVAIAASPVAVALHYCYAEA